MALCYMNLNNNDKANEYFKQCLKRDPNDADTIMSMTICAEKTGDINKAIEWAHKGLEFEPQNEGLLI